jgi:anti-sigma regulatory factor (Ser/Thr protein kinase)
MCAPLDIAGKTHESNDTLHCERAEARRGRAAIALTEEIADLLTDVIGAMAEVGYGARDTFATRLALEEAATNAVTHGHGNEPSKRARI